MMFAAPAVLFGLALLPGLYFLLRLTPPAARRVAFPPLALLRGLPVAERTPSRMPPWLLLLRLAIAALVIAGLSGPALHPPPALPGSGPVLLVIDNGWTAAPHWTQTLDAARRIAAAAQRAGRGLALLPTARGPDNAAPAIPSVMTAHRAGEMLNALSPEPWPTDRAGAAAALAGATEQTRIYLADGVTGGPEDEPGFARFLAALRPQRILAPAPAAPPPLLLPPTRDARGRLIAHIAPVAPPLPGLAVLAEQAGGGALAQAEFGRDGGATIDLPLPLANRVTRLVLTGPSSVGPSSAGPSSAGSVYLLDGGGKAKLIGLASGSGAAETPFLGPLYFLERALPPGSRIVTGDLSTLLADQADIVILADVPLAPAQQRAAQAWTAAGGTLIRFVGPLTAAAPDPLAPDPLLAGDRRLGGALTWTAPQHLAPFPGDSPLAGLSAGSQTTVSRQILADPARLDPATVWARLEDGTPLVLGTPLGKGLLVSILTTANADWSSLALAPLYPALLERLAGLACGRGLQPARELPLQAALNAFGALTPPAPGTAAVITTARLRQLKAGPATPPGIYGGGSSAVALNLGGHVPVPEAALLPHAEPLGAGPLPVDLGSPLLAAALLLFVLDLLVSLRLRGLPRLPSRRAAAGPMLAAWALAAAALTPGAPAHSQQPPAPIPAPIPAPPGVPPAALQTGLAYVETADPETDRLSADAMQYLSALVSARSSAQLGNPAAVSPGEDDIALYPMLYWLIPSTAQAPSPAACAALNRYMQHGGLLLLDTEGSDPGAPGSGAGFAPGAAAALGRVTACLDLPPLEPLSVANAIAHSFYIIQSFPGKFTGAPVLIASAAARDADGVTPIIIGQNDWAAAWARDATGTPEQLPLPGGDDQRVTADRFGVNLVIYALTGDYKADQTNLPGFLQKRER